LHGFRPSSTEDRLLSGHFSLFLYTVRLEWAVLFLSAFILVFLHNFFLLNICFSEGFQRMCLEYKQRIQYI